MQEAITLCEQITGRRLETSYVETNRVGDHIWYISDVGKFRAHYPGWTYRYDLGGILAEIYEQWCQRLRKAA
jgi:CDP-paratose 2-epimerase